MPVREIVHRLREWVVKRHLVRRPSSSRPFSLGDSGDSLAVLTTAINEAEIFGLAANVMSGVQIYGYEWPRDNNGELQWTTFLSGDDTSAESMLTVKYRGRGDVRDDIRLPWELNRLTWLLPVAAAAHLGDPAAKAFTLKETTSFLVSDRPGRSLRWNSAIELAVQALSLLMLDCLMRGDDEWTKVRPEIGVALANRHRWLVLWPSKFSSANNHRLCELVALVAILEACGVPVPSSVQEELKREISCQFLRDGFNAELSFDYHLFAVDLLLTLKLLAPSVSKLLNLKETLELIGRTTSQIESLCGTWPSANDSDEALIMARLTVPANAPKFLSDLCSTQIRVQPRSALTLPYAGYTFVRSGSKVGHYSVVLDHGSIGYGNIAAHGHSDALSIWLNVAGRPWLVEAGTFCYHANEELRNLLRLSQMHNTVAIDGRSLSVPMGPFLWNPARCARGELLSLKTDPDRTIAHMQAKRNGCLVASRIVEISNDGLAITDVAEEGNLLESFFIITPDMERAWGGNDQGCTFIDHLGNRMSFSADVASKVTVDRVSVSSRYGHLVQTSRVTVRSPGGHTTNIRLNPVK